MALSRNPITLTLLLVSFSPIATGLTATLDLTSRLPAEDLSRVRIELEVGGMLQWNQEGLGQADNPDHLSDQLPIHVDAKLSYHERRLDRSTELASDEDFPPILSALRYYHQAEAKIRIDQQIHARSLTPKNRIVLLRQPAAARATFLGIGSFLERQQLDLIDVIGNSLTVNRLLPSKLVSATDSWNQNAGTMAALLGLDTVTVCEVSSTVDKISPRYVQVRMRGAVHGMIDGAPTELELRGLYRFDHHSGRVTRMNLAVKEKRSVGHATPGLDVVAKVRLVVEPLKSSEKLTDRLIATMDADGRTFNDLLEYHAREQGFRFLHDRAWFVTSQERDALTLRRIENGDLIAYCTIKCLPVKSAGRQTSMEDFQKDIRFSLGKDFGYFVRGREWTNQHGHHCTAVVVRGVVEEIPVEWHYYLVAPEEGHRVSLALTMEEPDAGRLGETDQNLVDSLELIALEPTSTQGNSSQPATAANRTTKPAPTTARRRTTPRRRPTNSSRRRGSPR